MLRTTNGVARRAWVPILVVVGLGCQRGPSPELQRRLEHLTAAAAQRDTLSRQLADYTKILGDLSTALKDAPIQGPQLAVGQESPQEAGHNLLEKIKGIESRLSDDQRQLRQSQAGIRRLSATSDSLRAALDSASLSLKTMVASQEASIASLHSTVDDLQTENRRLTGAKVALTDSLGALSATANTAYYIVGTKDELLRKGIVVKEGGARFLFIFGKRGQVLEPSRRLNPADFTTIDLRDSTEIALPNPDKEYRIVSRQDLSTLATRPNKDGEFSQSLEIAEPDRFWRESRFLIVVES
jgi:chaperonin cofactor prefoldin